MRKVGGRVLAPMLAAGCVTLLLGCEEGGAAGGATATPTAPEAGMGAAAPVEEPLPAGAIGQFRWSVFGDAAVSNEGPPAKLTLSKSGVAMAVFDGTSGAALVPVAANERLAVHMKVVGTPGKSLKAVLTRQCDPEKGEDAIGNAVELSATPQPLEVALTFQKSYGCVRVDLSSLDGSPIDLSVSNLYIAKSAVEPAAPVVSPPPATVVAPSSPPAAAATTTPARPQ